MVIALDCDIVSHFEATGIVTYVLKLLEQLALFGSPHKFYVFARKPPAELRQLASCDGRFRLVSPRGSGWFWKAFGCAFQSRRVGADLLFIPAHRVPFIRPIPIVTVIHDLGFELFPETFEGRARRRISWATRAAVRKADHIIAVSESTKRDLVRLYACEPERIDVIHLAYDPARFEPSVVPVETRTHILGKYGVSAPFFLHVGVLQPRKNIIRLIDAFSRFVNQVDVSNLQLAIVGKPGWNYGEIVERCNAADIRGRVIITGGVLSDELPALYKSAFALMMPSLHEGFGLPILEAMACGTPVACSCSSSMTEVAGDAALLFDPCSIHEIAAAMLRLWREPELRTTLRERGFSNVQKFSWEKTARQTLSVFSRALTGSPGKRRRAAFNKLGIRS